MRIGREAAARLRLAAEVLEVRFVDAPFEIRARVDARGRVALEEDDVAGAAVVPAEEMIEGDLVQRRGGRERRDVAADAFLGLVGADDHRRRVPADEALDAAFDVRAAGHQRLLVGGNAVDVRRVRGERELDAVLARVDRQFTKQTRDFDGAAALQDIIKGIKPFAGFDVSSSAALRRNISS